MTASDSRDSSFALKPDLYVLDTHGVWCGQSNDTIELDGLGFVLVAMEDDEAVVWAIGYKSALWTLQGEAVAST
jgi:hypothetical protein